MAISQIRKALRDKSTKPQYIQTIPKHGYRFVAEVREVCQKNPISPSTENRSGIANIAEETQQITAGGAESRILKLKRVQKRLWITALAAGAFLSLLVALGPVTWKRAAAIRPQAPQIDNTINLSPPLAGQQFYIRINGQGIDPKSVRVVVTGKGCQEFGPCNVPNEILHWYGDVTDSQIERVPMTLAPGDFQVFVQNGPKGEASNSVPLTVKVEEKE